MNRWSLTILHRVGRSTRGECLYLGDYSPSHNTDTLLNRAAEKKVPILKSKITTPFTEQSGVRPLGVLAEWKTVRTTHYESRALESAFWHYVSSAFAKLKETTL